MVQLISASPHIQRAAVKLLGAAALLIVGIPLVPMMVPGYTQPNWVMDGSLIVGLGFIVVAFGMLWYDG